MIAILDFDGLSHLVTKFLSQLGNKVDTVDGKVLSSNDYTDEEKQKLANLSVATVEEVQEYLGI